MLRDGKNLKDPQKDAIKDTSNMPAPYQAVGFGVGSFRMSYNKTNKLITALYMVTDIIDKEEPLRNKLRTLGTQIISDMNQNPALAPGRISEIMSFLDIATALDIISQMNASILRREFSELDRAIKNFTGQAEQPKSEINLEEFLRSDDNLTALTPASRTSLGVQKGSTLLQALSERNLARKVSTPDVSKGQRRQDILNIIKLLGGSATIKDIKDKTSTMSNIALKTIGEKTLQRELIAMVHDGVLNKSGEKRWSRYGTK